MGPCEVCRRKVSWQREFSQTFVWNTAMYKEGQVCCLQMNYGIWDWQEFECKEDVIFCKQVFQTNEQPKMLKKGRKWLWPYWIRFIALIRP